MTASTANAHATCCADSPCPRPGLLEQKWVGTTECAALLRSFGLRARIVDFGVRKEELLARGAPSAPSTAGSSKSRTGEAAWEQVHPAVECDGCGQCPIRGDRYRSDVLPDYDLCAACHAGGAAAAAAAPFRRMYAGALQPPPVPSAAAGPGGGGSNDDDATMRERLLQWVWRYFTEGDGVGGAASADKAPSASADGNADGAGAVAADPGSSAAVAASAKRQRRCVDPPPSSCVRLTGRAPLYLQASAIHYKSPG